MGLLGITLAPLVEPVRCKFLLDEQDLEKPKLFGAIDQGAPGKVHHPGSA